MMVARKSGSQRPLVGEALTSINRGEKTSWVKLLQAVAIAANAEPSFEDAMRAALDEVCTQTGWPLAHVFRATSGEGLESTSIWQVTDADRFDGFMKATEGMNVKRGEELPGRVLDTGRAEWTTDVSADPGFLRHAEAAAAGLRSGLAFPVVTEDQVFAVMEFFSDDDAEPEPALLEVMEHIGTLLGQAGEHRLIEEELIENERQTRQIIETAGDAFVQIDADGFATDWNKQAAQTFGWTRDEMVGRPLTETIIPIQHRQSHIEGLQRFLKTGEGAFLGRRIEITGLKRDGTEFPIELNLWATTHSGAPRFNAFIHDISESQDASAALEEANAKLKVWVDELKRRNREIGELIESRDDLRGQTLRDPLTNLYNRRYMEESLDREIRRSQRNGTPLGIIMIDIDHFKDVNDALGHETGDVVLMHMAEFLQSHVRGGDIACRYGGEEFLLILPDAPLKATRKRAEALWEALRELKIEHEGKALALPTMSFGVAVLPDHGETRGAVLRAADAALYRAKSSGRNRVVSAGELF